jgi:micrococcal nuclease
MTLRRTLIAVICLAGLAGIALVVLERDRSTSSPSRVAVDRVSDGDTIVVAGDVRVRLVQIDTPEVYDRPECYGDQASEETKRLLPAGTEVRLVRDPATDSVDAYGRLLRYVVRADGLDVNQRLVADGAAAPYFFGGVHGVHAAVLLRAAEEARAARRGLWGACPGTRLDPDRGVDTGPAG